MTPTQTLSDRRMALLLAAMSAIMPFSIDAYLPAVTEMAAALSVGEADIQTNLSLFLVGQSLGVLIGGAWSDWSGRRTVALSGLLLYCLASLGLALLGSLEQFLLLRLAQAFGAGMVAVISGAVVRDLYEGRQAAQMFALIGVIMMAAPLLAPIIGWLMLQIGGWRAVFVFLLLYAASVWWLQWRFLPAVKPVSPPAGSPTAVIAGRYRRVFGTPEALGFLFFQAFSFSSMFAFLTESPYVYMTLYGMEKGIYALVFALNIITMTAFNRLTALRLRRGSEPARILLIGIGVQFAANTALVVLTQLSALPPVALFVGLVMLSVGSQGLVTANTQACFMQHFQQEGGSANGVLLSSQALIAASVGFITTRLHDGSAETMPLMMLSATLCGMVLLFGFSKQAFR